MEKKHKKRIFHGIVIKLICRQAGCSRVFEDIVCTVEENQFYKNINVCEEILWFMSFHT